MIGLNLGICIHQILIGDVPLQMVELIIASNQSSAMGRFIVESSCGNRKKSGMILYKALRRQGKIDFPFDRGLESPNFETSFAARTSPSWAADWTEFVARFDRYSPGLRQSWYGDWRRAKEQANEARRTLAQQAHEEFLRNEREFRSQMSENLVQIVPNYSQEGYVWQTNVARMRGSRREDVVND